MQQALNFIWGVKPRPGRGIWGIVRDRFWPFLMVLVLGTLLLVALVTGTLLNHVWEVLQVASLPGERLTWRGVNWLLSLVLLTLLFATLYKVLPDVKIAWQVVWLGGAVTAVLFTLGNYLIGLYLTYSSPASAFGAAGSLVVILVWVYYSSQVVLFGAELTEAYAKHFALPIAPTANAVWIDGRLDSAGSPAILR
jgi:membrane protein